MTHHKEVAPFNSGINQLLQLDIGTEVHMTAYADDLAIYWSLIGEAYLYNQMTTTGILIKRHDKVSCFPQPNVRLFGIEPTIRTGISRSQEKRSHGKHLSSTSGLL